MVERNGGVGSISLQNTFHFAGDDKFFIGSDYPHAEGFVDPVRSARERLSSLSAESVDKILCVNARKFYRIS